MICLIYNSGPSPLHMQVFPNPIFKGPLRLRFNDVIGKVEIKVASFDPFTWGDVVFGDTYELTADNQDVLLYVFSTLRQGRYIVEAGLYGQSVQTIVRKL